jgi:hypothetical protein
MNDEKSSRIKSYMELALSFLCVCLFDIRRNDIKNENLTFERKHAEKEYM